MKTINFLELIVALAVSPSKDSIVTTVEDIKGPRYTAETLQDRIQEFKNKLENRNKRWEEVPRSKTQFGKAGQGGAAEQDLRASNFHMIFT